ncbi:transcriptional regulator [Staphylococcus caeli]|uniref:Cytosolic protein n=1 Tax=Staphylococcus caeli TaxID=2201815 RepID=A0A1D4NQE2_9STAP|nr:transcriptional regulator [Staphylococcus caeli]AWM30245.1 hypothetical protein SCC82B_00105 [Staphylococcus caeli]SCT10080.1 Putative cytosolic protein [Staphylococcus caeli]SCT12904.1 Putative cytosolic protein [Staphylococcus caeli]
MATDQTINELFLNKINTDKVRTKNMMGEYLIYYENVVIEGLYDNRLLVKATMTALNKLSTYELILPYPNAKKMIFIPNFTEKDDLIHLFQKIKDDLD